MQGIKVDSGWSRQGIVGRRGAIGFCVFCVFCVFPLPRAGGDSPLPAEYDESRLIDALAAENMPELLERLIEVDPPDDPVRAGLVEIARSRLRYADAARTGRSQAAEMEPLIAAMRKLIDDQPDHELRPLWQTDLATLLLDEYLDVVNGEAELFVEFGVPTAAQRQAFVRAVTMAHQLAGDADRRLFTLRGELPRRPDHVARRVNTGLWERMIDEYYLKRTPFQLARSAYLRSLLVEADAPALRAEATRALEQTAVGLRDDPAFADAAASLAGRIRMHEGDDRGAEEAWGRVAPSSGKAALAAAMARVQMTARRSSPDAAIAQTRQLESLPLVRDYLTYRLLLTDLEHRLQPAQSEQAYEPYARLLADRAWSGQVEGLRRYIDDRWIDVVEAGRESERPAMVRMAVGGALRERGQAAKRVGDESAAARWLERSSRVNGELLEAGLSQPMSDEVKATASYNLALTRYLLHGGDLPATLDAAARLAETADRYPGFSVGERAIGDAIALLRPLHAAQLRAAGVDEAYRQAARVLFNRYPHSAAADGERVYYAFSVLQADGEDRAAIELYRKVVAEDPTYDDAQREMIFALERLALRGESDERRQAGDELGAALQAMRRREPTARTESARRATAAGRMVGAQRVCASGDLDGALGMLNEVEREAGDLADVARMALERRILMLADTDRAQPLADAATRMMRAFPDEAAAVIDGVLTRIDERIEQARQARDQPTAATQEREAAGKRIDELAATAATLAELLSNWAGEQGFDARQMAAYELIRVKVLLLSGEAAAALTIAQRQAELFPDDLGVLHYAGEARFQTGFEAGDEPSLLAAAGVFDRIIAGLSPPYPSEYWHAWMRRLQINERLGRHVDQIAPAVRRLQLLDPRLGGEPYSRELQRLARKFAGER